MENHLKDTHAMLARIEKQQADERQALGRYTLQEAAIAIVESEVRPDKADAVEKHWERDWPMLDKLIQAAQSGELPVYLRDHSAKFVPDDTTGVLWFSREAYWDDLNAWLDKHEKRIAFRFPSPTAPEETAEHGSSSADAATTSPAMAHKLSGRATYLRAEIAEARRLAKDPDDSMSVWTELVKLAEKRYGALAGYSSDGVQYCGKKHQATGEFDVLKKKGLRERMGRRAKPR